MAVTDFKITAVAPRVQYTATALQTTFVIPFRFFEDGDIDVYLDEATVAEDPSDYTITGAGTNSNGSLVFDTGLTLNTVVTIVRNSTIDRTTNFIDSGDWRAQNVNDQFNRAITFIQEVKLKAVDLALTLPVTSLLSGLEVPDGGAAANANRVWGWDPTGEFLVSGPTFDAIQDAEGIADDAQQSADDAEDAKNAAMEWAINPYNDPVSVAAGGDNSTTFSALHWAYVSYLYASSINLPSLGAADTVLRVNSAGLALEYAKLSASNVNVASQAEAEAGVNTTKLMTPARVSQAIAALGNNGSGWVSLKTVTASNSTTVDFVNGVSGVVLNGTYRAYAVVITGMIPATDTTALRMRTSTNAGSSYDSGAGDYDYTGTINNSSSATTSDVNSTGEAFIPLTPTVGNDTAESTSGRVEIYYPSGTNRTNIAFSMLGTNQNANTFYSYGTGSRLNAGDVDAIRFYQSAGNITIGTFELLGLA